MTLTFELRNNVAVALVEHHPTLQISMQVASRAGAAYVFGAVHTTTTLGPFRATG